VSFSSVCGVEKCAVNVVWVCSLRGEWAIKEMRMGLFSVPPVVRLTVGGASALSALGLALQTSGRHVTSECSNVTF
jgi:hypothetical protein